MKLEYSELEGGIRLIKLTGKLDLAGTNLIEKQFMQHCAGENVYVLVDLSQVMYLSSIGIPILVNGAKSVAGNGGRLALLNPQPTVKTVLDITGVTHMIRVYYDLKTACARIQHA